MKYVYLIRSKSKPKETYVGITSDLKTRLAVHNTEGSIHTAKFKPWKLQTYIAFSDSSKARAFEQYLKPGSDRALEKKGFW